MNEAKYLEDRILLTLLATAGRDDTVPQAVYRAFDLIGTRVFQGAYDNWQELDAEPPLVAAFAEFWDRVVDARIHSPLDAHLSHYFFSIWKDEMEGLGLGGWENIPAGLRRHVPLHLESDILAHLLEVQHSPTETLVYRKFKVLVIGLLRLRYGDISGEIEGIYDEAAADAMKYIQRRRLSYPMTARLLTFFTRFARNQWINWLKKEQRRLEDPQDDEKQFELLIKTALPEEPYSGLLETKNKRVRSWQPENDADLVERILAVSPPPLDRYLRMRFLEELSYADMVVILKEEGTETNENALRGRIYDALAKARKALNLD